MNTVLLTGATGFIGSHLLRRAAGRVRFRCLVRPESVKKIKVGEFVQVIEGDLLSRDSIRKAIEGANTVLHLGALIRRAKPEEIYRVNGEGTRLLVEEARKRGEMRFIFVSTENVLREDLKDAYANSKREAEALVQSFGNALILRPCFVYGRGDSHGLGRLIEIVEKFPVVPLFSNIRSQIQPIYIDDMVEYLLCALVKPNLHGSYIIAGPEKINLNDFMKKACRLKNKEKLFIKLPYNLLKLTAILCTFFPSVGWGVNQLHNIYKSRTYSIEKTARDFDYYPRGIEEGLRLWLS